MKHLKQINEIAAKYDRDKEQFNFDPADNENSMATFYLHKGKQGFSMEILEKDRIELEEILTRNKIDYTVAAGNILPF